MKNPPSVDIDEDHSGVSHLVSPAELTIISNFTHSLWSKGIVAQDHRIMVGAQRLMQAVRPPVPYKPRTLQSQLDEISDALRMCIWVSELQDKFAAEDLEWIDPTDAINLGPSKNDLLIEMHIYIDTVDDIRESIEEERLKE